MFRTGNIPEGDQAGNGNGSHYTSSSINNTDGRSTPHAVSESEILAREIKDGTLSGYVGHGTLITGDTSFKGMLRVDGRVGGKLSSESGTIIIGDGGQVDADLKVAVAIIRGTVNGEIVATQRIELGRTAKVKGNIQTASLAIDPGAFFEGMCRMTSAPKQVETPKADAERVRGDRTPDNGATAAGSKLTAGDKKQTEVVASTIPA